MDEHQFLTCQLHLCPAVGLQLSATSSLAAYSCLRGINRDRRRKPTRLMYMYAAITSSVLTPAGLSCTVCISCRLITTMPHGQRLVYRASVRSSPRIVTSSAPSTFSNKHRTVPHLPDTATPKLIGAATVCFSASHINNTLSQILIVVP